MELVETRGLEAENINVGKERNGEFVLRGGRGSPFPF